jgi:predicted ABC-type ATPase
VRSTVLQNLIKAKDFALELNLGFEHQYNYALSMKRFSNEVKLNVILFFTDHVQLCQDRAIQRFKKGLHLVKPDIIEQMYHNTIPLLKANFHAIDRLIMLDATEDNDVLLQGIYSKAAEQIKVFNKSADWFGNDVLPFIKEQLAIQRFDNPTLKSWDKDDLGPPR